MIDEYIVCPWCNYKHTLSECEMIIKNARHNDTEEEVECYICGQLFVVCDDLFRRFTTSQPGDIV